MQISMSGLVFNSNSVKNKALLLSDFLIDLDIDIFAITETWLSGNGDLDVISDLTPSGYKCLQIPRQNTLGGGVALILKENFHVKNVISQQFSTFEHLEAQLNLHNTSYRVIVVYRPPPSVKNGYTEEQFMDELSDKLINCTTAHQNLLVMGDFNIHMDKPDSPLPSKFTHLLEECALSQLVKDQTHCMGHILDLVITKSDNSPVHSLSVYDLGISDHRAVIFKVIDSRPGPPRKTVQTD